MEGLRILAAGALEELRENPPAHATLPKTRAFADALNKEVSKPGKFDPTPWVGIAVASGEQLQDEGDVHLWLWGIAGETSLLAVPTQRQVDQSRLVENVRKVCEALATQQ